MSVPLSGRVVVGVGLSSRATAGELQLEPPMVSVVDDVLEPVRRSAGATVALALAVPPVETTR